MGRVRGTARVRQTGPTRPSEHGDNGGRAVTASLAWHDRRRHGPSDWPGHREPARPRGLEKKGSVQVLPSAESVDCRRAGTAARLVTSDSESDLLNFLEPGLRPAANHRWQRALRAGPAGLGPGLPRGGVATAVVRVGTVIAVECAGQK